MRSLWIENEILYDGSQLRPLFAYENFGLLGHSVISWVGPCNVSNAHMKDGEDLFAGEKIYSEKMLHFIVEIFDTSLETAIFAQRLLSASAKDLLGDGLIRQGDDLYLEDKKLSISIASKGVLSSMIHFGINVSSKNTPVPTVGLSELKIDPRFFSIQLMDGWCKEFTSVQEAKMKVFSL